MIRRSRMTKKTTMKTTHDRYVTESVTFAGTFPAETVSVAIPTLDDDSAVTLETAPREHRYNYPCMDGKPKPEGKHGYAANGIIFEFDMDDADGTTIIDRVNGLVLTEQGDPAFQQSAATAGLGHGLTFDGTGDALDYAFSSATIAADFPLVTTGDFSVEVAFNAANATTGAGDTLVACRDGAAGVGWQMHFDANQYVDFHVDDTTEAELTGATDAATGVIVHAIACLDRDGHGVLYINGAVDDTTDISGSPGTLVNASADTRFSIGGDAARTAGDCFFGSIYFVRVYNYALSAAEALENYRIMMNQGYPGWKPLADPADGDDLVIGKSGSDPCDFDLTEYMTLKKKAFRANCATVQTATNDLDFVWSFE